MHSTPEDNKEPSWINFSLSILSWFPRGNSGRQFHFVRNFIKRDISIATSLPEKKINYFDTALLQQSPFYCYNPIITTLYYIAEKLINFWRSKFFGWVACFDHWWGCHDKLHNNVRVSLEWPNNRQEGKEWEKSFVVTYKYLSAQKWTRISQTYINPYPQQTKLH